MPQTDQVFHSITKVVRKWCYFFVLMHYFQVNTEYVRLCYFGISKRDIGLKNCKLKPTAIQPSTSLITTSQYTQLIL